MHHIHKGFVTVLVNGTKTEVRIDGLLQPAHGPGLDGEEQRLAHMVGTSSRYPGQYFVQDAHGNTIMSDANQLYALLRYVAHDFELRAVPLSKAA